MKFAREIKILVLFVALFVSVFSLLNFVQTTAQNMAGDTGGSPENSQGTDTKAVPSIDCVKSSCVDRAAQSCDRGQCDFVARYINPAIQLLSAVAGLVFVVGFIFAGIKYSTARGEAQKVAEAKGLITKVIVGILFYAFLYGLILFLVPGANTYVAN